MKHEEHVSAAQDFLEASALLRERGFDRIAAESMWGALVDAINALAHIDGDGHARRIRDRKQVISAFIERDVLGEDVALAFQSDAIALHNYFYDGNMRSEAFAAHMRAARALATKILAAR